MNICLEESSCRVHVSVYKGYAEPKAVCPSKAFLHLQLSAEVKDLLSRIFQTNESQRIDISQIKEHPWFKKELDPEFRDAQTKIDKLQDDLNRYTRHRRIHDVRL